MRGPTDPSRQPTGCAGASLQGRPYPRADRLSKTNCPHHPGSTSPALPPTPMQEFGAGSLSSWDPTSLHTRREGTDCEAGGGAGGASNSRRADNPQHIILLKY